MKLEIFGRDLVAEIVGSKVNKQSGQPWRRLSWPIDHPSPLVAMLIEEIRNGLTIAQIKDARRYSGTIRAAGERERPRWKKTLSPYCFRHAAASDMKARGLDNASISQALDHCSDAARSYYGQWQMGSSSGGVVPKTVEAARQVVLQSQLC